MNWRRPRRHALRALSGAAHRPFLDDGEGFGRGNDSSANFRSTNAVQISSTMMLIA